MKSYFSLIVSLLFTAYAIAQTTYIKELKNIRPSSQNSAKQFRPHSYNSTSDGSIFLGIASERQGNRVLSRELVLLKLSGEGNFTWSKVYSQADHFLGAGSRGDNLSDLIQLENNQFVGSLSAGRSRDLFGEVSLLLSFDNDGSKIWDTQIRGRVRSNLDIKENGNFRFTHWLFTQEIDETLLVEMNSNGSVVDVRQYTSPVYIQKFLKTKDGNTFFIAYDANPDYSELISSPSKKSYIGKLDKEDNVLWMRFTEDLQIITAKENSIGDIILSAALPESQSFTSSEEERFMHISNLTSEGQERWTKRVPLFNSNFVDNIGINTKDEILLLSNYFTFEDAISYSHLTQMGQDGTIQWTKILPQYILSLPSHRALNITEDNHIQTHGMNLDKTIFFNLDEKGQSETQLLPSICVEAQDASINWSDTLINFIGTPNVELPWRPLTNGTLSDTSVQIIDFAETSRNRLTPYFELPDTTCALSNIKPTVLPNDGFDQYSWTFESSDNPKFNDREPDAVTYASAGTFQVTLITDQDNCLDTFSREIVILDKPEFDLGEDMTVCDDEPIELDAFSENLRTYTWSNGVSTPTLSINESGQYNITVTDAYCTAEDSINITFINELYPNFEINLGKDTTICMGDAYQLKIDDKDIDAIIWNDGDSNLEKNITEAGNYQVTAFIGDCPFEADVTVDFKDCSSQVFIPNAFSPNEDGNNEEFFIGGKNITLVAVQVFDRWGSLVFDDINRPWNGMINGQLAPKGTYIYQVIYIENLTGRRELVTGTVSLIR